METLLLRFGRVALALLVLYGLLVAWIFKGPDEQTVQENLDYTVAASESVAEFLQTLPIDSWSDSFYRSQHSAELWLDYDAIEIFPPEIADRLRSGEHDSGVTDESGIYASRLVPDSGYVVTLTYLDDTFYGPWIIPNSAGLLTVGVLIAIVAAYYFLVVRPLRLQLSRLEHAAQGVAGGNFALRMPVDSAFKSESVATRFNEMASQIETLVSENNSILEDHREMLRAVAHEFRGPLARIRFALDMSEDMESDQSDHDLFRRMGNDLDELNLLVGEVLSYARLQPGSPSFTFATVDVAELLGNTISEARLNYPDVQFEMSIDTPMASSVDADSFYLQRAILNLLNNAARHAASRVRVTSFLDDQCCTIHVDDDGDGVPAHWQGRVFEPFVRVDPSRSRQSGGVGLGLSIARRVIENHRGEIKVGNAPDLGGARFSLLWPIERTSTAIIPPPVESAS